MARSRKITADFFLNEDLAALPFECRLLLAGLWCLADREGRLEDRPLRIKAAILPHDSVDVDLLLEALQMRGFILRYRVEEAEYIQIKNFQIPHHKEVASVIPPPRKPVKINNKPLKDGLFQSWLNVDPTLNQHQPNVEPTMASKEEISAQHSAYIEDVKDVDVKDVRDVNDVTSTSTTKQQDQLPSVTDPIGPKKPKKPDELSPAVSRLRKKFDEKLEGKFGPHSFPWGVAGAKLRELLIAKIPEEEISKRIDHYFASTDKFIEDNGFSVTLFAQRINLLAGGPLGRNGNYAGNVGNNAIAGYAAPVTGKYADIVHRADKRSESG